MSGLLASSHVATQQYFDKRRSFAAGMVVLGMAVGYTIWPPVAQFLVATYGWRGAFLLMSGILLHGIPIGALLRPIPQQPNNQNLQTGKISWRKQISDTFDLSLFKDKMFFIYNVATFFTYTGVITPYGFTYLRATEYGFSSKSASLLLSIIGFSGLFGRLCFGWLGDRSCCSRMVLQASASLVAGACTVVSFVAKSYSTLAVYSALFGLFVGR
jgi:predicted MFS family arabinose efflux permease